MTVPSTDYDLPTHHHTQTTPNKPKLRKSKKNSYFFLFLQLAIYICPILLQFYYNSKLQYVLNHNSITILI